MHDYLISFLLGIVEGLTEFLPVSSTAHLKIVEHFLLGKEADTPFWNMYTIVIQLGAIMALPIFFWNRIRKFVKTFPRGERGNRTIVDHPLSLVMIAFAVTAGPAYLLTHMIKDNLNNLHVIGAALLFGGIIMWAIDALAKRPRIHHMEDMGLLQAIWIGACQILSAVFPGTSRSMSTIAAGQTSGMSRASALEFSFFLSIPTMLAATGSQLYKAIKPKHAPGDVMTPLHVSTSQWVSVGIGMFISFVVSLIVVAWFMHWVRRRGFAPFAIYRIVVGVAVLFWARHLAMQG